MSVQLDSYLFWLLKPLMFRHICYRKYKIRSEKWPLEAVSQICVILDGSPVKGP